MSFDKIFFLNNGLNENDFAPGRGKYVGGDTKIVAIPETRETLRVKLVGFDDYVISGKLTDAGFTGILNWLRQQPDIIDSYYKLNAQNFPNYFVVYEVSRDTSNKQVFRFTIVDRKTVPALKPSIDHITLEELQAVQKGIGPKDLVVDPGTKVIDPKTQIQQTYGLTLPVAATAIDKNKNTQLVAFFRDAYLKIKKDANVSSYAGLAKVKTEINSGELGKATTAFLYALNAGFGIKDWSGEEIEKNLTAALTSKISAITESAGIFLHPNGKSLITEADLVSTGFDPNAFVTGFDQAIKGMGGTTNTGDIIVPAEGFKYDSTGRLKNAELQKFQEILMKNLPTYAGGALKNRPPVAAFLRTKADGIYGNKTKGLIGYLKVGLTDPKYPDNDDTTIKADFVNRMLKEFKLVQERKTYLGLDGHSIIIEGFDTGAADVASGISSGSGNVGGNRTVVDRDNASNGSNLPSSSNARTLEGVANEYKVQNGFWVYRPKGSKGSWQKTTNTVNIAKLQKNFPEDKGVYILPSSSEYMYKPENGVWKVYQGNKWVDANDASQLQLKNLYGLGTGAPKSSAKALTVEGIDKIHREIASKIKGWFPNAFQDYKHTSWNFYGGDDEEGAWQEFKRRWSTGANSIGSKLKKTKEAIGLLPSGEEKDRCNKNQSHLERILTSTGDGSFYAKFQGGTADDTFVIKLYQTDGSTFRKSIDTDF